MQRGRLTAVITAALLGGVLLVACGDDTPACAATTPKPIDALRMPGAGPTYRPPPPRYTYKPPPAPRKQDTYRAPKTQPKPTSWKQYKPPHKWGQPYGKGRPVAPQPTVTHWHGGDYRTYPGYYGYYPVGVWPIGYGDTYGCRPLQEGQPEDD